MPITGPLPTRTDNSAGRIKINGSAAAINYNTMVPETEWNTIARFIVDVTAEVGLSDGSIPGSVVARLNALEASLNDATSIQGIPVNSIAPTLGQSLVFDGAEYVPTTGAGATLDNVMTVGVTDNNVLLPALDPLMLRNATSTLLKVGGASDEVTVDRALVTLIGKVGTPVAISSTNATGATTASGVTLTGGSSVNGNAGVIAITAGSAAAGTGSGANVNITAGSCTDAAAGPGSISLTAGTNASTGLRNTVTLNGDLLVVNTDTVVSGGVTWKRGIRLDGTVDVDVRTGDDSPESLVTATAGTLFVDHTHAHIYQNLESTATWEKVNRDWGNATAYANLPNSSANALTGSMFDRLAVGDVAYVTGSNTGFRCTSVGTDGGADAVWFAPVPEAQGFVVGNSSNGDTLANCNVLDSGSGTVLATALATSNRTVIVRAGTYTVSTTIAIGSGVAIIGSDSNTNFTRFENTSTNRQVISGASSCTVKNINFLSVAAALGSADTSMISCFADNTTFDNCTFFSAPTTVNDTMESFINVLAGGTAKFTVSNCTFSGPVASVFQTTAGAIELACVRLVDDTNTDLRRIINNKMSQCDVGIIFNGRSIITGNSITAYRTAIADRSVAGTDSTGSIISNNTFILSVSGTTTPVAGVTFTGLGGAGVLVSNNYFRNTTGGANGTAVNISPAANMFTVHVSDNTIVSWDSGIVLGANTQDGLVRDNIIYSTTPTITNSGVGNIITIDTAEITDAAVTSAKLRNSVGVSLIGRSANTVGVPADIAASADNQVMARVAGALGFASVTGDMIAATTIQGTKLQNNAVDTTQLALNGVTNAIIRQSAGLSLVGRATNSTGNVADITGTDGQVARVAGTTLGFGTIVAAGIASSAVTMAKLAAWPAAKTSRAAAQSIPDTTETAVDFDTSVFAFGGADAPVVSTASNNISITRAGIYRVEAKITVEAFGSSLSGYLKLNGATIASDNVDNTNVFMTPVMGGLYSLAASDLLTVTIVHFFGSPQNTGTGDRACTLTVEYIGPTT